MISSKFCLSVMIALILGVSMLAIYHGKYDKLDFMVYLLIGNFWVLMICNSIENIGKRK